MSIRIRYQCFVMETRLISAKHACCSLAMGIKTLLLLHKQQTLMPGTHECNFRRKKVGCFFRRNSAQAWLAYTRSHKSPSKCGGMQHYDELRKLSSMLLSMRQILSENASEFCVSELIQTKEFSDRIFFRLKIWEPALNLLLAEILTAKVRWSIDTVGIFVQKLTSDFCCRKFRSCVRGIIV